MLRMEERVFPRAMITPTLIVLLVMTAYPLIFTLIYSFTDYNYLKGMDNAKFILFQNYASLIKNGYFRQALTNTVKFTLLAVGFEMIIGLLVALFVHSMRRGKKVMRTLLLLPYLLPTVTVALSWRLMLSVNYGIVNQFLTSLGLPVFNWFMDTRTAFGTILVIDVWQNAPFVFLLLYAALQSVPEDLYEAARIDGAGALQQFWFVNVSASQNEHSPLRADALHRYVPLVRKGEYTHRRRPCRNHHNDYAVFVYLWHKQPEVRLWERGRRGHDHSGAADFQYLYQARHQ